jgi:hypothetical protein
MWSSENLHSLNGGGSGVFITPTTIQVVIVDGCTGHDTIHCPMRATSADRWDLERLTIEVLCPLAAPDSPVCSDFCIVHYSVVSAVDRWA